MQHTKFSICVGVGSERSVRQDGGVVVGGVLVAGETRAEQCCTVTVGEERWGEVSGRPECWGWGLVSQHLCG